MGNRDLVWVVSVLVACGGQAQDGPQHDPGPLTSPGSAANPTANQDAAGMAPDTQQQPGLFGGSPGSAREGGDGLNAAGPAAGAGAVSEGPAGGEPMVEGEIVVQDAEAARAHDLALIAESNGWTIEQAEQYIANSEALDTVTGPLAAERPDSFVGSAVGPEPEDPPRLYIKGEADAFIDGLLANAPVAIRLIDNQPFSRAELDARQEVLVGALRALGYQEYAVGANIEREGLLEADVSVVASLPATEQDLLPQIPASIRDAVSITFH